ncbi:MAG: ComEC/Rec2 family competence protein [Candidatus Berkelbacteria bacterium]
MKIFVDNLKYSFRIFTIVAVGFLIGVAVGEVQQVINLGLSVLIALSVLFITVGAINYLLKNQYLTLAASMFVFIFIGIIYNLQFAHSVVPKINFGTDVTITGVVADRPDLSKGKQKIVVDAIENGRKTRILVFLPHFPAYRVGDELRISGQIDKPAMIEDFDYPGYLKGQKIFSYIRQPKSVEKIGQSGKIGYRFRASLFNLAQKIENVLQKTLPEPQASLAEGLILGAKKDLPADFVLALQRTGLTHIVALSGYNVTIIVIALSALLLTIIGRKKTFWLSVVLVLFFVTMTGGASSVVRAAIFSIAIIFGQTMLGRPGDQTNLMLLAAIVMVLFNPFILCHDIGFQLSFLAFCGLIYLSPILKKSFASRKGRYIPENIRNTAAETLSAQFAVLPIMIFQFKQISLIAPVSNILILWIIPLTMLYSFIVGLIGLLWLPAAKIFADAAWPLLTYIIDGVVWMSKIPFASYVWK